MAVVAVVGACCMKSCDGPVESIENILLREYRCHRLVFNTTSLLRLPQLYPHWCGRLV